MLPEKKNIIESLARLEGWRLSYDLCSGCKLYNPDGTYLAARVPENWEKLIEYGVPDYTKSIEDIRTAMLKMSESQMLHLNERLKIIWKMQRQPQIRYEHWLLTMNPDDLSLQVHIALVLHSKQHSPNPED